MASTSNTLNESAPGIADLIRQAQQNPTQPIIQGLLHEHETAGLHGAAESFKTVLTLQLAESIATAQPFLDLWDVPSAKAVYFFETEMGGHALGQRLQKMFAERNAPGNVHFASEDQIKQFKKDANMAAKFDKLNKWVLDAGSEVLIIDTCNPFFRGQESPNDETKVGEFFDHLEIVPAATRIFVRHNRKPCIDDMGGEDVSKIRGSGQFIDVPDLLIENRRVDKRTHQLELAVTKFRHGSKPDNLNLWFDAGEMRLVSFPPVIDLLRRGSKTRPELLEGLQKRFGIAQRKADDLINEQRNFLHETQQGHNKVFSIDEDAARAADWFARLRHGS